MAAEPERLHGGALDLVLTGGKECAAASVPLETSAFWPIMTGVAAAATTATKARNPCRERTIKKNGGKRGLCRPAGSS